MPNKLTEAEIQKLIPLVEQTKWHYRLDKFTDESLGLINKSVNQARREIASKLATINPESKFTKQRLETLAQELQDMTVAIQHKITGQIENTALEVAAKSYPKHADILSFGGLVPNFNAVQLTAAQLKSIVDTPIGGKLLNEWVDTSFTANIKDKFQEGISTGMLKGESYKNLVKRFKTDAFTGLEKDMEAITRTQVQSINTNAMKDTMMANADIMKGWKWNSVYENRTCIRCLSLDAKDEVYPIDGGPQIPLHVNCRCFPEPITKTFRELGVDIDEMEESYRPYTIRGKIDPVTGRVIPGKIGVGGGRIIETGRFLGSYEDFFKQLPENVQTQMLGPTRFGMYKEGKLTLAGMTDASGNAFLIKELEKGVVRKKTSLFTDTTISKLTNDEWEALNAYKMYGWEVNEPIRKYKTGIIRIGDEYPLNVDLDALDSAFDSAAKTLNKDTIVYRGLPKNTELKSLFTDRGFTSTTLNKADARLYAGKDGKIIEIHLPKGMNVVKMADYVEDVEGELLLKRNLSFIQTSEGKYEINTKYLNYNDGLIHKKVIAKAAKKEAKIAKFTLPSAEDLSVKGLKKNNELFEDVIGDYFERDSHIELKMNVEKKLKARMAALSEADQSDYLEFQNHFKRNFSAKRDVPERDLISKWANTSGDEDELATFMQMMAKEEFSLKDPVTDHLLSEMRSHTLGTALRSDTVKNGARKFLREMYNETQEQFAKYDVKELTLFRGVVIDLEEYAGMPKFQPMSSFSTSVNTARDFATQMGVDGDPIIVATKIDVKNILSTPASGYGCLSETEVVALSGRHKLIKVVDIDNFFELDLEEMSKSQILTCLKKDLVEVTKKEALIAKKAAREAQDAIDAARHEAQRLAYYAKKKAEKEAAKKAAETLKLKKLAKEKAAKELAEKLAKEKAAKELAEKLAKEKAEREAAKKLAEKLAKEKAAKELAEKLAKEKAAKLAAKKLAKEKAAKLAAEKLAKEKLEKEALKVELTKAQKKALDLANSEGAAYYTDDKIQNIVDKYNGRVKEINLDLPILTVEDFKELQKRAYTEIPLHINVDLDDYTDAYREVNKTGKLKNQFQLGEEASSGGTIDPYVGGERDTWEKKLSGGIFQDSKAYKSLKKGDIFPESLAKERPIYGYLGDSAKGKGYLYGEYGDTLFVLKEEVKDRISLTPTDSSFFKQFSGTNDFLSTPKNNGMLVEGLLENAYKDIKTTKKILLNKSRISGFTAEDYVEAQIYGGIDLKRDLAKIVTNERHAHIEALAKKWGVKYEVRSEK